MGRWSVGGKWSSAPTGASGSRWRWSGGSCAPGRSSWSGGTPQTAAGSGYSSARWESSFSATFAAHEPVDLPEDPGRAAKVAEKELSQRAEEYIEAYRAAKAQGR